MEKYVICLNSEGYAASLEVRKLYELLPDPKAKAEPIQLRSPGHKPARGAPRGTQKHGKTGSATGQKPAGGKRPATAQRFGSLPGAARGGAGAGQAKRPAGRGGGGNNR